MATDLPRFTTDEELDNGILMPFEVFWRDQYNSLLIRGYKLRPRYAPDWTPSWLKDNSDNDPMDFEDRHISWAANVLDAERTSDGALVMLKGIDSRSPRELASLEFLRSKELIHDSRNHTVPVLDTFSVPSEDSPAMIVLPHLVVSSYVAFQTIGEFVSYVDQTFEGLEFMHRNCIAHWYAWNFLASWLLNAFDDSDIKNDNILMDGLKLYDIIPHPHYLFKHRSRDFAKRSRLKYTRTEKPVRYLFIDFGLSMRFDLSQGPPLMDPGYGGVSDVPEFRYNLPVDPFAVDVFCLGRLIDKFCKGGSYRNPQKAGLEFLAELVSDMQREDPKTRPTMSQALERWNGTKRDLSWWKLRSRLAAKEESFLFQTIPLSLAHFFRTLTYIVRGLPAVPIPPSRQVEKDYGLE